LHELGGHALREDRLTGFCCFEVKMVMIAAAGIELRVAGWALVGAVQILPYAQFSSASPAQHSLFIPFAARPDFECMADHCIVAIFAGIVGAATLHPDGNYVQRFVVMSASGLGVQIDSAHEGARL
jgi:hypothetical protein